MEGYWPTQPEEGVGASGTKIIHAGSQALIGEKKMKSVRWDTSGANPMGWKYIA